MKHYIIIEGSYDVDANGNMSDTYNIDKKHYFGTTSEGIEAKMQEIADSIKDVEQGIAVEIVAYEATETEQYEYDYEEGDDITEYLEIGDTVGDSILIEAEYKSLEGAIICRWRWDTHVGYARECLDIEVASWRDDESILIQSDTFRPQVSVLAYAHELTGDEDTDKNTVLESLKGGKWRNLGYITQLVNDMFPDTEPTECLPYNY